MNRSIIVIAIGGAIGSIARYLMATFFTEKIPSAFPYGTLFVNIIGCFVIGLVYALSDNFNWLTPQWRLFLATGICGGFTTFSSFSYENVKLLQQGNYFTFISYSTASFVLGLLAAFIGIIIIKNKIYEL